MISYENLLNEGLNQLPEFKREYDRLIKEDVFDFESGNHIVFSYAFNPVLIEALNLGKKDVSKRFLDFLEKMASSEDRLVTEVCDFTVLEEVHDAVKDRVLYSQLGPNTKKGFLSICNYMAEN